MYDCNACERLWREYSDATMSHIKVSSRRQIATLQHDSIAVETLDRQVREAAERLWNTRNALRFHQDSHRIPKAA